jgi:WD40 repeat protein
VTGSNDGTIRCWETTGDKSRKELWRIEAGQAPITAVLYSPDGSQILSGSQKGMIQVWDADTLSEVKRSKVSGMRTWIQTMDWSRDGTHVLLGARGRGMDSMSLWSIDDGWEETVFKTNETPTWTLAFSHSGDQAYSFCSGSIYVNDLVSGKLIRQFGTKIEAAAFSLATERVWTADEAGNLRIWNTKTGEVIQGYTAELESTKHVALSADGTIGLTASRDGMLRVWNLPPTSPQEN